MSQWLCRHYKEQQHIADIQRVGEQTARDRRLEMLAKARQIKAEKRTTREIGLVGDFRNQMGVNEQLVQPVGPLGKLLVDALSRVAPKGQTKTSRL